MNRSLHQPCRVLALLCLHLCIAQRAMAWGEDGHRMIMAAAVAALPEDSRRIFAGMTRDLNKLCLEADRHSGPVPAEACKHWIDIEKFEPGYLEALRKRIDAAEGTAGATDEDLRGAGAQADQDRFTGDPPPYSMQRAAPLWDGLPATITLFRAKYGRMELQLGTVVYQPYLYAKAFAGALARGDRRRAIQYAGWLGHYTADLFVPVHATSDYKGQYSGNLLFDDREHGDVHVRFESAFVKSEKDRFRREMQRRMPEIRPVAADRITPLAIAASRDAYAKLAGVLDADRAAAKASDPRGDWNGFLRNVAPAWRETATAQLTAAAGFLATLLHSAQQPGFSGTMAR